MEEKKVAFMGVQKSAFDADGIDGEINSIKADIKRLYLSDTLPWVIGYSGGKDSTACLQLIWYAIKELAEEERKKPIYVISTDTLVENPVVAMWVEVSLEKMRLEAIQQKMPIEPKRLTPDLTDRFWVNLIGKGYPAPRPMFRWCTSRLKINPSNNFILDVVAKNGEAILVLGTRKAESSARKKVMEGYEGSTRDLLSRNGNPKLDRVWIYPPIVSWTNDDVWEYLVTYPNPWGYENNQLLNKSRYHQCVLPPPFFRIAWLRDSSRSILMCKAGISIGNYYLKPFKKCRSPLQSMCNSKKKRLPFRYYLKYFSNK